MNHSAATTSGYIFQSDVGEAEGVVEALILSIICLVAVSANVSLWLVVLTTRDLRNESNILILCLSLADLLVSAVSMPITVYTIITAEWVFSESLCTAIGYLNMLTFTASVQSLGAISINRFIKICKPSRFIDIYTFRNVLLMSLGVWLYSGLLSVPPLAGWAIYSYLPNASLCFCDWTTSLSYALFMIGACFCGPCSIMTFCYVSILRTFCRSRNTLRSFAKKQSIGDSGDARQAAAAVAALVAAAAAIGASQEPPIRSTDNKKHDFSDHAQGSAPSDCRITNTGSDETSKLDGPAMKSSDSKRSLSKVKKTDSGSALASGVTEPGEVTAATQKGKGRQGRIRSDELCYTTSQNNETSSSLCNRENGQLTKPQIEWDDCHRGVNNCPDVKKRNFRIPQVQRVKSDLGHWLQKSTSEFNSWRNRHTRRKSNSDASSQSYLYSRRKSSQSTHSEPCRVYAQNECYVHDEKDLSHRDDVSLLITDNESLTPKESVLSRCYAKIRKVSQTTFHSDSDAAPTSNWDRGVVNETFQYDSEEDIIDHVFVEFGIDDDEHESSLPKLEKSEMKSQPEEVLNRLSSDTEKAKRLPGCDQPIDKTGDGIATDRHKNLVSSKEWPVLVALNDSDDNTNHWLTSVSTDNLQDVSIPKERSAALSIPSLLIGALLSRVRKLSGPRQPKEDVLKYSCAANTATCGLEGQPSETLTQSSVNDSESPQIPSQKAVEARAELTLPVSVVTDNSDNPPSKTSADKAIKVSGHRVLSRLHYPSKDHHKSLQHTGKSSNLKVTQDKSKSSMESPEMVSSDALNLSGRTHEQLQNSEVASHSLYTAILETSISISECERSRTTLKPALQTYYSTSRDSSPNSKPHKYLQHSSSPKHLHRRSVAQKRCSQHNAAQTSSLKNSSEGNSSPLQIAGQTTCDIFDEIELTVASAGQQGSNTSHAKTVISDSEKTSSPNPIISNVGPLTKRGRSMEEANIVDYPRTSDNEVHFSPSQQSSESLPVIEEGICATPLGSSSSSAESSDPLHCDNSFPEILGNSACSVAIEANATPIRRHRRVSEDNVSSETSVESVIRPSPLEKYFSSSLGWSRRPSAISEEILTRMRRSENEDKLAASIKSSRRPSAIAEEKLKHASSEKRASIRPSISLSILDRRKKEEFQLAASLMVVVVIFIICWFPYCISMLVSIVDPEHSTRALDMPALLLGYLNSCVNPIVYGIMNKRFKAGYKKLFGKCLRLFKPEPHPVNLGTSRRGSMTPTILMDLSSDRQKSSSPSPSSASLS